MEYKKFTQNQDKFNRSKRNSLLRYYAGLTVGLCLIQLLISGCTKSPEKAREELSKSNIQYNADQFLNNAKTGNTNVVKLFLQAGMDPNVKNDDGQTALMLAAYTGNISTVKLLLENGAYINVVDKFGDSALTWAEAEKHTDIVQVLKKAEINKTY